MTLKDAASEKCAFIGQSYVMCRRACVILHLLTRKRQTISLTDFTRVRGLKSSIRVPDQPVAGFPLARYPCLPPPPWLKTVTAYSSPLNLTTASHNYCGRARTSFSAPLHMGHTRGRRAALRHTSSIILPASSEAFRLHVGVSSSLAW